MDAAPPNAPVCSPIVLREHGTARDWTMILSPSELRLTCPGVPDRVVSYTDRFVGIARIPSAIALVGPSPLGLDATPEAHAQLGAWIGPPTREHLRFRLKRLVRQGATTGGALILWALFFEGSPGIALCLGGPLLVLGLLSYFVEHRALFAAMALVYALNVFVVVASIAAGASGWLGVLALLALVASSVQFREYRKFEGLEDRKPAR